LFYFILLTAEQEKKKEKKKMKLKEADSKSFGLLLDRNTVGHTPACQASFRIGT
jgi:hypothetical protein